MSLRLPSGQVTVLLGEPDARRRLMAVVADDAGALTDRAEPDVRRLTMPPRCSITLRMAALSSARGSDVVLVDRLTDGMSALHRRHLLAALRPLAAAGPAVVVDDEDAVAALAVADGTLREDPRGGLVHEVVGASIEEIYGSS